MKTYFLKIPFIVFFLILLIFFYLLIIERDPSKIPSTLIEKDVPNFETETLLENKKFISIEEFGSEIVLVNFFATWCKPCRDEHIFIQRFSEENKIKIIGIPYSIVAIDKKGKIAINWGVYGIPETFIVNSKGIIKYRHVGPITKKIYKKINQKITEIN